MSIYYVYAIGTKENLDLEKYDLCYIGVTSNPERRWSDHISSPYTVGNYIRTHSLLFYQNMKILYKGSENDCFSFETKMRPFPFMGLNEATGGKGGYTRYDKERNQKIANKIKEVRKKKYWNSSLTRSSYAKEKNPNAKKWLLISPSNERIEICGNLNAFCREKNILASSLRYYEGQKVPEIVMGYGGFRAKTEKSLLQRQNTTSWTLQRLSI